jgi:hypothetical protein
MGEQHLIIRSHSSWVAEKMNEKANGFIIFAIILFLIGCWFLYDGISKGHIKNALMNGLICFVLGYGLWYVARIGKRRINRYHDRVRNAPIVRNEY